MAAVNNQQSNSDLAISPRDILFECPSCHKSLVIDEAAQGMIVDCPQCKTSVIVPPKTATVPSPKAPVAPPPSVPPASPPSAETKPAVESPKPGLEPNVASALERLVSLGNQLKELQTQRTEIATNVAARLNEINRQMVMLARQETAHHQVVTQLNQLVQQLKGNAPKTSTGTAGKTQVNLRA